MFRAYLPGGDKTCVIDENEMAPEFDLRQTIQQFQILKSFCKHFHVRITTSVVLELLDGKRTDIPESAIEECRVPGLFTDSSRPTRKISSEHIMSLLYLDSLDTALSTRAASKQRGMLRLQQTSANIFCLDHIPTDSFVMFPPSSTPPKKTLAVVNLLDSEAVDMGRANYALISHFAITASSHM